MAPSPRAESASTTPTPAVPVIPVILRKRGIAERIIEEELHTDEIALDAAVRAVDSVSVKEFPLSTDFEPPTADEARSGAVHASTIEDWAYGINRETSAPLRCGMNFSYNALIRGTGVDDISLPNVLRYRMATQTEEVVKSRRKAAKTAAAERLARSSMTTPGASETLAGRGDRSARSGTGRFGGRRGGRFGGREGGRDSVGYGGLGAGRGDESFATEDGRLKSGLGGRRTGERNAGRFGGRGAGSSTGFGRGRAGRTWVRQGDPIDSIVSK